MSHRNPIGPQDGIAQGSALEEDTPFGKWPDELKKLWLQTNGPRMVRDLRFLHGVGLLVCIACLVLDAQAGVLQLGATLRLGVVVPLYVLAIWLVGSHHRLLQLAAVLAPVGAFAGSVTWIGLAAGSEFADRYIMAAAMLVTTCLLLVPLRFGPIVGVAATGFAAIALPVLISGTLGAQASNLLLFALLCSTFPLAIKHRSDRLRDVNFLLTLKSRQAQIELLAANRELEDLSQLDPLTGLLNRRGFEKRFAAAFEAAQGSGEPLAVLLMDLDNFKAFNDTHGHQLGDECLTLVGGMLKDEINRQHGIAGRYGGEEFIAALIGSGSANAIGIAERLRRRTADLEILDRAGGRIKVTASFGARIGRVANLDRENFVRDADQALYLAKDEGRNRVVLYHAPSQPEMDDEGGRSSGSARYDSRVKHVWKAAG